MAAKYSCTDICMESTEPVFNIFEKPVG